MPTATITSKGQVTIPKKIRDQLQLKPGDTIDFEIDSFNRVRISAKKRHHSELYGILYREGQKPRTIEEMNEGIAKYIIEKYKR